MTSALQRWFFHQNHQPLHPSGSLLFVLVSIQVPDSEVVGAGYSCSFVLVLVDKKTSGSFFDIL